MTDWFGATELISETYFDHDTDAASQKLPKPSKVGEVGPTVSIVLKFCLFGVSKDNIISASFELSSASLSAATNNSEQHCRTGDQKIMQ